LLWFAFATDEPQPPTADWGWDDHPDDPAPVTPGPRHGPAGGGPPLPAGEQPRPRLRPGEQLADRTLPRPRREHPPLPERTPARTTR
jgi:hypothetical protein